MRLLIKLTFIVITLTFAGCSKIATNLKVEMSKEANPWTHLNLYNNPDNFQFAIVSDRTGKMRKGIFKSAIDKLNLLRPEFVMSIGDLIDGDLNSSESESDRQWDEFDSLVDKLQMPFFYVPGNHDISNDVMAKKWHQRFGASYYYFIYHDVLFLSVDTQDPPPRGLSNKQIEYFQKILEDNKDVRWTLIFMHQPLWDAGKDSKNWQKLESLLKNRPYTVFAGHLHKYNKIIRNDRQYYILSTTGGGWEDDEMPKYKVGNIVWVILTECQFDHIVWVTMTDNGPVIANLLLEGILDDEPCL